MTVVGLTRLKRNLKACVELAQKEPLLVTRRGTPLAVLIGVRGGMNRMELFRVRQGPPSGGRSEYDFRGGKRGEFAKEYAQGTNIVIRERRTRRQKGGR